VKIRTDFQLLKSDKEFNFDNLEEDEKQDLERIQYETYIHFDMYVEALENSGFFYKKNNQYLKSNKNNYFNYFQELKSREEDI
jgi:hypothetical protein